MANPQTPSELEQEIEQERSALARSLEDLQEQFSTDKIVSSLSEHLQNGGGDVVNTIVDTARRNPVPTALVGIGAAWLIGSMAARSSENKPAKAAHDTRSNPTSRGFASEMPEPDGFDERVDAAAEEIRKQHHVGRDHWGYRVEGTARTDYKGDSTPGSFKGKARDLGQRVYAQAEELVDQLSDGTDDLNAAARERIKRVRMAALSAQFKVEQASSRAKESVAQTAYDQPLLMGAVALAAGAAIGASLPRTERGDRVLGAHRDRLFDEAERVFLEEKAKLRAVAEAAVDEGKAVLKDATSFDKDSGPSGAKIVAKAEGKGKSALRRVSDAARDEAERQNLGSSGH